jgi:hypothetical protein
MLGGILANAVHPLATILKDSTRGVRNHRVLAKLIGNIISPVVASDGEVKWRKGCRRRSCRLHTHSPCASRNSS